MFVHKKRPFASEGHLGLPRQLAPAARAAACSPGDGVLPEKHGAPNQLQLLGPAPYALQEATVTAYLLGDGLAALDLQAGDRVVLARGRAASFGDLAALRERPESPLTLWKVYPEGDRLQLSDGQVRRTAASTVRVEGVVLAVKRRF